MPSVFHTMMRPVKQTLPRGANGLNSRRRRQVTHLFRGMTLALAMLLPLGGCSAPSKEYVLRLDPMDCAALPHKNESSDADVLILEEVRVLAGLDRNAVFIAQRDVLSPSTIWYWEGPPGEVLLQSLLESLNCLGPYRVVWPYRSRMEHEGVLRGRMERFELRTDADGEASVFAARLVMELWSRDNRKLRRSRAFESVVPTTAMTAQATAVAASEATRELAAQIAAWLEAIHQDRSVVSLPDDDS